MNIKKCVSVCIIRNGNWIKFGACLYLIVLAILHLFEPNSLIGLNKFMVVEGDLISITKPTRRGYVVINVRLENGDSITITGSNKKILKRKDLIGMHAKVYYQDDISMFLDHPSTHRLRQLEVDDDVVVSYKEMRGHLEHAKRIHLHEYFVVFLFIVAIVSTWLYVRYCKKQLQKPEKGDEKRDAFILSHKEK